MPTIAEIAEKIKKTNMVVQAFNFVGGNHDQRWWAQKACPPYETHIQLEVDGHSFIKLNQNKLV